MEKHNALQFAFIPSQPLIRSEIIVGGFICSIPLSVQHNVNRCAQKCAKARAIRPFPFTHSDHVFPTRTYTIYEHFWILLMSQGTQIASEYTNTCSNLCRRFFFSCINVLVVHYSSTFMCLRSQKRSISDVASFTLATCKPNRFTTLVNGLVQLTDLMSMI